MQLIDFMPVIGMHLHNPTNTLFLATARNIDAITLGQHTGIHSHKGQLADIRVRHQLECQCRELLIVVRLTSDDFTSLVHALHSGHIDGRRQQLHHRIQHALYALVLEGRAAQHGLNLSGNGAQAQAQRNLGHAQLTRFQVLIHQLFIGFCRRFQHALTPLPGRSEQIIRDVLKTEPHALSSLVPHDRFHQAQVDHALEAIFSAHRNHHRHRIGLEAVHHHLTYTEEIRPHAVHLVDEGQARHLVLVGLTPHRFRLRLYPADGVIHHDRAVQHAHGAFNLDGEIHVAGSVDDIDAVLGQRAIHASPKAGGGRRSNGDATLLLLAHPVHGGRPVMHFPQLVTDAGVEKNALRRSGFTSVNMRRDTNVPIASDGCMASHDDCPWSRPALQCKAPGLRLFQWLITIR